MSKKNKDYKPIFEDRNIFKEIEKISLEDAVHDLCLVFNDDEMQAITKMANKVFSFDHLIKLLAYTVDRSKK